MTNQDGVFSRGYLIEKAKEDGAGDRLVPCRYFAIAVEKANSETRRCCVPRSRSRFDVNSIPSWDTHLEADVQHDSQA